MLDQKVVDFVGVMMPNLDEKGRRIFLASLSNYLGYGSITELQKLTGVSRVTIISGKNEISAIVPDPRARPSVSECHQVRASVLGRPPITEKQPQLVEVLLSLLDGNTVGNPENPLCWTTKSLRHLQSELNNKGFKISHVKVGELLEKLGFSLQQNKKYVESGKQSPDRDEQFNYINSLAMQFQKAGQPVISVDAKKKELIGNYKNNGREYRETGSPILVNDHDFLGEKGKAAPYGIYDINKNQGFVNLGISSDTAEFAVNSIRYWWRDMGREAYPEATDIMITADAGGSNGRRNRLWKKCLQDFATETGITIHVSHFPPGTSKWNKIEHRLFSFISKNWRARPLSSLAVVISLISSTTTQNGLTVRCVLDNQEYMKGIKVTDKEMNELCVEHDAWHGEWNYCICPKK